MSKDGENKTSLLNKVAKFIKNPTVDWADLDRVEHEEVVSASEFDNQESRQALKEMIARKRRNDMIRKHEFDSLRKIRRKGRGPIEGTVEPPSYLTSELTQDSNHQSDGEHMRERTLRQIDEIEAQLSYTWFSKSGNPSLPMKLRSKHTQSPTSTLQSPEISSQSEMSHQPEQLRDVDLPVAPTINTVPASNFSPPTLPVGVGVLGQPRPSEMGTVPMDLMPEFRRDVQRERLEQLPVLTETYPSENVRAGGANSVSPMFSPGQARAQRTDIHSQQSDFATAPGLMFQKTTLPTSELPEKPQHSAFYAQSPAQSTEDAQPRQLSQSTFAPVQASFQRPTPPTTNAPLGAQPSNAQFPTQLAAGVSPRPPSQPTFAPVQSSFQRVVQSATSTPPGQQPIPASNAQTSAQPAFQKTVPANLDELQGQPSYSGFNVKTAAQPTFQRPTEPAAIAPQQQPSGFNAPTAARPTFQRPAPPAASAQPEQPSRPVFNPPPHTQPIFQKPTQVAASASDRQPSQAVFDAPAPIQPISQKTTPPTASVQPSSSDFNPSGFSFSGFKSNRSPSSGNAPMSTAAAPLSKNISSTFNPKQTVQVSPTSNSAKQRPSKTWSDPELEGLQISTNPADISWEEFTSSAAVYNEPKSDPVRSDTTNIEMFNEPVQRAPVVYENPVMQQIEVTTLRQDTDIEEAAISFANGADGAAEQTLIRLVSAGGSRRSDMQVWLTLFDLYRATNKFDAFNGLVPEFTALFGRSAPQMEAVESTQEPSAKAPTHKSQSPVRQSTFTWICPAQFNSRALSAVLAATKRTASPWRIDWRPIKGIDTQTLSELANVFNQWADTSVHLQFLGVEQLLELLAQKSLIEDKSVDPNWWQVRLALLRLCGNPDQFDQTALDYCITYEISPPAWTAAKSSYTPLEADGQPKSPGEEQADGEENTAPKDDLIDSESPEMISAASASGELTDFTGVYETTLDGQFIDNAARALEALPSNFERIQEINFDCLKLTRMGFNAASDMLNWSIDQKRSNRSVIFRNVNRLVAAFFSVIGINTTAQVLLRKD
jgi:hypothetical protein